MVEIREMSQEELRAMLDELLAGWAEERPSGGAFESRAHAARVATIYALAVHAHGLGIAVRSLYDQGLWIHAVPLIRSAFEAAITAAWIQQIPDALPAYMNRNHSQQRALRDTVQSAGWLDESRIDQPIPADFVDPYVVSAGSKLSAAKTVNLCDDLRVGAQAYSAYRALSWMTHPTAILCDHYAELPENSDVPLLLNAPRYESEFMAPWLHLMCSSLVWAARSLNLIDSKRAKTNTRNRLRHAAQQLRIIEALLATDEAVFRGEKSERARVAAEARGEARF